MNTLIIMDIIIEIIFNIFEWKVGNNDEIKIFQKKKKKIESIFNVLWTYIYIYIYIPV